jgi:autotransporter-associated beta strand protein
MMMKQIKATRVAMGSMAVLMAASWAAAQSTIAQWTFETTSPTTAGPHAAEVNNSTGVANALGFHAGASTYSSPAGNGSSKSFSSTAWAVGDYYQFSVPTSGFQSIQFSIDAVSSNTGPKNFNFLYSTDGTNFTNAGSYSIPVSQFFSSATVNSNLRFAFDLSAVSALSNTTNPVFFRVVMKDTVSVNNGVVAGTGTSRVDNVTVLGTPSGARTLTWNAGNANFTASNAFLNGANPATFGTNTVADNVVFTGSQSGTVTLTGDVAPLSMNVTGGTYTFTGGSTINGSGTVTFSGGTTTLEGGTKVNFANGFKLLPGATLRIGGDFVTQANTVDVPADGGTFVATGAFDAPGRTLALRSGATVFDTAGNPVSLGILNGTIPNVSNGGFVKGGAGTLTIQAIGRNSNSNNIASLAILGGALVIDHADTPTSFFTYNIGTATPGGFAGDLQINEPARLNINGGNLSGGGKVLLKDIYGTAGTYTIATSDSYLNVNAAVSNEVNLDNVDLTVGANNGPTVTSTGTLAIGVISGTGNVNFTVNPTAGAGGGSGTVILNDTSSYSGNTAFNMGVAGVVQLGVNNALPSTTTLTFNTIGNGTSGTNVTTPAAGPGQFDLNGKSQALVAIATGTGTATTGTVSWDGGRITNTAAGASTLTVTLDSGAATYAGLVTGNINLVKQGGGTQVLTQRLGTTGSITVSGGTLELAGTNASSATYATVASSTGIAVSGGTLKVDAATGTKAGVVVANTLSLSGTGVFDLANNDLIVRSGGATPAAINGWLVNAANLKSSSADSNYGLNLYVTAYAGTTFDGVSLNVGDIVVNYGLLGDVNLDGRVDGKDYKIMQEGLVVGGYDGISNYTLDVNKDGVLNASDLGFVISHLSTGLTTDNGTSENDGGVAAIPEPSAMGVLVAAMPLVTRRRRSR